MFENLQTEIDDLVDSIKTQQLEYVMDNGKYKQFSATDTGTLTYQVNEHVAPTGIGFTCLFYATDDNKEYVKAVCFGKVANSFDWTEIIEDDLT